MIADYFCGLVRVLLFVRARVPSFSLNFLRKGKTIMDHEITCETLRDIAEKIDDLIYQSSGLDGEPIDQGSVDSGQTLNKEEQYILEIANDIIRKVSDSTCERFNLS